VTRLSRYLVLLLALTALGATAAPSRADDGGRAEVRIARECTGASSLRLRVRAEDGWIRIEAEIERARPGSRWTVIVLHERRTVSRVALAARGTGEVELRRTVRDWFGSDAIVVRATAAGGETCRASAAV
jgi:hypothetical protein